MRLPVNTVIHTTDFNKVIDRALLLTFRRKFIYQSNCTVTFTEIQIFNQSSQLKPIVLFTIILSSAQVRWLPWYQLQLVLCGVNNFYRAMHFSAKRGIAIACRLSVRLSVPPSVCEVGEL